MLVTGIRIECNRSSMANLIAPNVMANNEFIVPLQRTDQIIEFDVENFRYPAHLDRRPLAEIFIADPDRAVGSDSTSQLAD